MAAGDSWIKVWPVHQVFCLLAWLTLHHQSPLKHLHYSRYSNKKLTHITLRFLWLVSKTPRYLNLLGSLLTLEPEAAIYCFLPAAICLYTLVMDGKWDKPLDTGTTPTPTFPILISVPQVEICFGLRAFFFQDLCLKKVLRRPVPSLYYFLHTADACLYWLPQSEMRLHLHVTASG